MEPLIAAMARPDDPAGLATPAYGLSKRAVMRMAERRCVAWAARGARICTISPGTIYTPMGRTEAEQNPLAARVVEATPMARWGRAADIAAATAFLLSDEASFITGVDLRVDGGVTAAMKAFAA
jgi:NAD(P)-dependent dehydrogenase (short-subunit alcohol dehydrogenase family)